MSKPIKRGRTAEIIQFIRDYHEEHNFAPTVREIARGVGLCSTSTAFGYLNRMTRDGLITSIPGTPRSIRVVEQKQAVATEDDGSSLLCCKFHFPDGTQPTSVIAMVSDGEDNPPIPVVAERVEVLQGGTRAIAK